MLIKNVTKRGEAVPYSPQEALVHAIAFAVAKQQSTEFVYWVGPGALKVTSFSHTDSGDGGYDAFSSGVVKIGKTRIADDKFFVEKPYDFSIHYKSSKDDLGAPHLDIVEFSFEPTETNPSKTVGSADTDWKPIVEKQQGGSISKKYAQQK